MSYSDGSHLEKGDGSRPSSAERLLFNGPGSDTTEHSDERSWSNARPYRPYNNPRSPRNGNSPPSMRQYNLPNLPSSMDPRSASTSLAMPAVITRNYESSSSNESYSKNSSIPFSSNSYVSSGYSSGRTRVGGGGKSKSIGYSKASSNPTPAWMSKTQDMSDDEDDALHDYRDAHESGSIYSGGFPVRALVNVGFLVLLVLAMLGLFAAYPIISELTRSSISTSGGSNLGGVNGSGQIADLPELPQLIDPETPEDALFRTGFDGKRQRLVFSDEFNLDGRSFYPGDDPFWEAVDLHYWGTQNYEWYDPAAVTTSDGAMHITLSETPNHNLNFRGGMVQSWNKFCFTGGYLVASIRLPGRNDVPGLWPAFWSMGNLGRAGYGASLEGLWPYSYETCDVGTLQNQTDSQGNPAASLRGGTSAFNRPYNTRSLSWATGQKLSACTCPDEDHPGPKMPDGSWKGRASPEIDVFEAQAGRDPATGGWRMEVSQSYQLAPFNNLYTFSNSSGPAYEFYTDQSILNSYTGAVLQQAASAITTVPQEATEMPGGQFAEYGFEYVPGISDESHVTWTSGGEPSWRLNNAALDPDPISEIGRRPVSNEPMYIILNLGLSQSFGTPDFDRLTWPTTMSIDWVRVYQPEDNINIGCDPPDYPTHDYINRHWDAYHDPTKIVWGLDAEAGGLGEDWPRNRLDGGCSAPKSKMPGNPLRPHAKSDFVPASSLPNYG